MSFIEKHLLPDERVLYVSGKHWKIFLTPSLLMLFGVVFLVLYLTHLELKLLIYAGVALVVISVLLLIPPLFEYLGTEFGVTNRRILIKVGLIRRRSVEILLNKVEGVQIDQGLMGRIFKYGSIVVTGMGGTRESFRDVAAPMEFRKRLQESMDASGHS